MFSILIGDDPYGDTWEHIAWIKDVDDVVKYARDLASTLPSGKWIRILEQDDGKPAIVTIAS